jgi:hypothetical protein
MYKCANDQLGKCWIYLKLFNCDFFDIFAQDFSVLRLRGALPLQEAPNLAAIKVCTVNGNLLIPNKPISKIYIKK